MDKQAETTLDAELAHYAFSLRSVCWGYRDIFRKAIAELYEKGELGENRREVTDKFFELLKESDQSCFDHVVKEFLSALNPRTRWLLSLPGVFTDVVDLGGELARSKVYYGTVFFKTLGEGGFGDTPRKVRNLISQMRRLRETDEELAISYMLGYAKLIERLSVPETERYIQIGLDIFGRNRQAGLSFMEGTLRTAETYIRSITKECRLEDIQHQLQVLIKALVGYDVEVDDLGGLDSDELLERGTSVVCMYRWLYVPARICYFNCREHNRKWYVLTALVAAGLLAEESFCGVHGHPHYPDAQSVVGEDILRLNLFQIVEYARVFRRMRQRWPGTRGLLDFGLKTESDQNPPCTDADRLFFDMTTGDGSGLPDSARKLISIADASANFFETLRHLRNMDVCALGEEGYPGVATAELRPFSFIPDFLYPGAVSTAPSESMIADMKQAAEEQMDEGEGEDRRPEAEAQKASILATRESQQQDDEQEEDESAVVSAGFPYSEWSCHENDYHPDCCLVHEDEGNDARASEVPDDVQAEARRVSRIFEQFKPQLTRQEKHLPEGDMIDEDMLVDYLIRRQKEPAPQVDFYSKPRVIERDLAVVVLLDESGSTGEQENGERIIDIEKHAALILGEGLASLGDTFSIAGFSSNGPQNCRYTVYKGFEDVWDREAMRKVMAPQPSQSTRIGPALRHAGFRLQNYPAQQRLIILITDGRPMDTGYDPNTRYAQYDVRMACEENARRCIHTFAISTEENTVADMEIMFPRRRFTILTDIAKLPRVLPRLYSKLTLS